MVVKNNPHISSFFFWGGGGGGGIHLRVSPGLPVRYNEYWGP